jgi:hypothetical protein
VSSSVADTLREASRAVSGSVADTWGASRIVSSSVADTLRGASRAVSGSDADILRGVS